MPRKTDGLPFEVHRSPSINEDGRVVLYATTESNRTIEFKDIDGWACLRHVVRQGELQRSFDTFLDECSKWLSQGYRVQTPLGVFSLKLGMKRKVTDPQDVRHEDAEFKSIEFRPSAEFTNLVERKVKSEGFRYVHKTDSTLLRANEKFMLEALHKSIHKQGGYTTVSRFIHYSGLSKYAATKQLRKWCSTSSPLLRQRRLGHSIIFELVNP